MFSKPLLKIRRQVAFGLLVIFLMECFLPITAHALTSGPTQPEVQSFVPASYSGTVDPFTGDFSYNVPLLTLPGPNGGYPFNLSYQAGINVEQEASWVGLGWNLQPGSINRQLRGYPDEFNGIDKVKEQVDMKPFTMIQFPLPMPKKHEVYGFSPDFINDEDEDQDDDDDDKIKINKSARFNVSYRSDHGLSISSQFSYGSENNGVDLSLSPYAGATLNARFLKHFNLNYNTFQRLNAGFQTEMSNYEQIKLHNASYGRGYRIGTTLSLNNRGTYTTALGPPMRTTTFAPSLYILGKANWGVFSRQKIRLTATYQRTTVDNSIREIPTYGYWNLHKGNGDAEGRLDFSRTSSGQIHKEKPFLSQTSMGYDIYSAQGQGLSLSFRAHRSDYGTVRDAKVESGTTKGGAGLEGLSLEEGHEKTDVLQLHFGVDASGSIGGSTQGGKENLAGYHFKEESGEELYEPFYFRVYGENGTDNLQEMTEVHDSKPFALHVNSINSDENSGTVSLFDDKINSISPIKKYYGYGNEVRKARNTVIQQLSNKQLGQRGENTNLHRVTYYEVDDGIQDRVSKTLSRNDAEIQHHPGSFTVTRPDGMRYIYALPAYNHESKECYFSVDKKHAGLENNVLQDLPVNGDKVVYKSALRNSTYSEDYFRKVETPKYAHAHLLTSIVGSDYVDVNGNGPDEADEGYWVKFTYEKVSTGYRWRSPFYGATFEEGQRELKYDDKGAYSTGTKEIWYLHRAETASHIALFHLTKRKDGYGAKSELQDVENKPTVDSDENGLIDKNNPLYKLDKIELYSRPEWNTPKPTPIQTVHLEYDYTLCRGVYNHENYPAYLKYTEKYSDNKTEDKIYEAYNNSGKLTLKKVWFTYGHNNRGELSPYEFSYQTFDEIRWDDNTGEGSIQNPENPHNADYDPRRSDRWGVYRPWEDTKPIHAQKLEAHEFPYTDQMASKEAMDIYAGMWSLKKISLPSGASLEVEYESDDYGYVQQKQAMQMVPITQIGSSTDGLFKGEVKGTLGEVTQQLRLYFKLSKPVPTTVTAEEGHQEASKYLDGTGQIYYQIESELNLGDYTKLKGYVELNLNEAEKVQNINVDKTHGLENRADGQYCTRGYVTLKNYTDGGKNYHPFAVAAWEYIDLFRKDILSPHPNDHPDDEPNKLSIKDNIVGQANAAFQLIDLLATGFYNYAYRSGWGDQIDLARSLIRLNVVDGAKYGGGHRVRQIRLSDNDVMDGDGKKNYYGQVYEYTTEVQSGEEKIKVSSGVAAYEPLIGGEENALRRGYLYTAQPDPLNFKPPYHLYEEGPFHEAHYPAPSVGYSKVRIRSLGAMHLWQKYQETTYGKESEKIFADADDYFSKAFSNSGMSEQEYYTAKDYPTLVSYTPVNTKMSPLIQMTSLLGIENHYLYATQGYTVELNDMHGKPKIQRAYAQTVAGKLIETPISEVKYYYKEVEKYQDGEKVLVPSNAVRTVVEENEMGNPVIEDRILNQEYEVFADVQNREDKETKIGLEGNVEITIVPTPPPPMFFSFIPQFGDKKHQTKTHVWNKVIHRRGILYKIETFDGQAEQLTENLLWDALTGQTVLTKATGSFTESPVYSYQIPAHLKYKGMGPAYLNTGLTLEEDITAEGFKQATKYRYKITLGGGTYIPVKGDKIFIYGVMGLIDKVDMNLIIEAVFPAGISTAQTAAVINKTSGGAEFYNYANPRFLTKSNDEIIGVCTISPPPDILSHLVEGDEFIVGEGKYQAVITKINRDNGTVEMIPNRYIPNGTTTESLYLYRSGRRNHLQTTVGNITSLKDPTKDRVEDTWDKKVTTPDCITCHKPEEDK